MYQKILARIYFQYAVVWKKKTRHPVFYSVSLFSIVNYVQVCSIVLIIDLLFKSSLFKSLLVDLKWPVYLILFFFFYFINYQVLKGIISQTKLIQQYEANRS